MYKRQVVNFVALLGWSPENNQEIFSLDELVKEFNYKNISKSPAVFDIDVYKRQADDCGRGICLYKEIRCG